MDHIPKIGVITNLTKDDAIKRTREILTRLKAQRLKVQLESATAAALGLAKGLPLAELAEASDILVVLGGDGTILHTARQLGPKVKPLAGINTGRLGFLTMGTESELGEVAHLLASGKFVLSNRSVVEVEYLSKEGRTQRKYGLNEATITRGTISRLIRLEVLVDGVQLNRYSGDGLIVATPTGSTAYSLSAGGPLVTPDSGVFVVTPICPHALASRAIVVRDDSEITIRFEEPSEELLLTVDGGKPLSLRGMSSLQIRKAPYAVPLAMMPHTSFFAVLQDKLRWMGTNT